MERGWPAAAGQPLGARLMLRPVVLVVGWSAAVAVRPREARSAPARHGSRTDARPLWTCPQPEIGGFPLSIVLQLRAADVRGSDDAASRGCRRPARRGASLFPDERLIDLTGPLTIQDNAVDGADGQVGGGAPVSAGDLPGTLDRGHLAANGVEIAAARTGPPASGRHARVPPLQSNTAAPVDAELAVTAKETPMPMPCRLSAPMARSRISPPPFTICPIAARACQRSWKPWRQAGGSLEVDHFALAKGIFQSREWPAPVDDRHRVQGRLDAHFAGLDPWRRGSAYRSRR